MKKVRVTVPEDIYRIMRNDMEDFGVNNNKICNYILDNSYDENEINQINIDLLNKITGEFGCLEIINSASVFELPLRTLEYIRKTADEKNIKIILKHRVKT